MEINKFVALDFEYLPTTQEIVQIGYAFVSNGEIIEERYQYIKPRCTPEYYNNQIYFLLLTGITYDMLHDAPTMEEVIPDLYKILNNNIIVAHNARSADLCVLTKELERCNIPRTDGHWPIFDCYCTLEISRLIKSEIGIERCGLSEMCEYFNIPLNHHNACSDATATAKLFIEISNKFNIDNYKPIKYCALYTVGKSKIVDVNRYNKANNIKLEDVHEYIESPISNICIFSKEIIVLTGFTQSEKEYLIKRLVSIGATIKQNITNDTTCIIAGKNAGWSKLEKATKRGIPIINIKDINI